jgi:transcriptional regulator with XRE-family HTH domain
MKEIFSQRVKALRTERGMTQQQLGGVMGLSKNAVNDMEHGRKLTALDKVALMADFFGVSIDYLVGRSDDPARH